MVEVEEAPVVEVVEVAAVPAEVPVVVLAVVVALVVAVLLKVLIQDQQLQVDLVHIHKPVVVDLELLLLDHITNPLLILLIITTKITIMEPFTTIIIEAQQLEQQHTLILTHILMAWVSINTIICH